MGQTVVSTTVQSGTVEHDDDIDVQSPESGGVTIALASMGTSPAVTSIRGGSGRLKTRITSGSGSPAIAANNIQITCPRAPRKVFLSSGTVTPGYHVASISGSVINIGTKVAPAASTAYDLELIVLY